MDVLRELAGSARCSLWPAAECPVWDHPGPGCGDEALAFHEVRGNPWGASGVTWVLWWLFGQSVLPQPNHSCGSGQSRRCFPATLVESRISSLDTEPFPESQSGPMAVCSQLRGALPSPSSLCSLGEGGSPQVGSAWRWKGGFKTASYPVCLWTDNYCQFCIKAAGLGGC